jgi:hypothetical protein
VSPYDWDRAAALVIVLAALWAFVHLVVLFFRDPKAAQDTSVESPARLAVSPFRSLLDYWSSEAHARRQHELETARIEMEKFKIERGLGRGPQ